MRKLVILIVSLCMLAPTAALASSHKGFKVAVSNSFITHSWRTQMVNNLQKRLALYEGKGWISEFQIQHAGPDVDLQRSHIQNFIDSEVDILIIDPVSLTALNPVIEDAVDAGIVTVISDEPVTTKAPYVVLPTHDVWMEKLAVYVMDRMGGKGNVVYLSGIDGAPASDMRDQGFERALKKYPNVKLLAKVFGSWDPALAQQAMADALAAYPKIDGVVAHDGECLSVKILSKIKIIRPFPRKPGVLRVTLATNSRSRQDFTSIFPPEITPRLTLYWMYLVQARQFVGSALTERLRYLAARGSLFFRRHSPMK